MGGATGRTPPIPRSALQDEAGLTRKFEMSHVGKMGHWALSPAQQGRLGRGSSAVEARGADPTLAHVDLSEVIEGKLKSLSFD